MNQLIVENLHKSYRTRVAVQDVSLTVNSGEIVGLLGPNGAGKTTCFYMIVGLVMADRGSIILDQNNITKVPIHERARLGLAYLPQEPSIFRKLNVQDNILAILELQKLDEQARTEQLEYLLDELDIAHLRHDMAISLSGGERRRVEIARCLAMRPRFVLLDEPFAGIDPIAVLDIKKIICLLAKHNIGVLVTDHNVREMLDICHRAYIVTQGYVLASGSPSELVANDQVRTAYLGSHFQL